MDELEKKIITRLTQNEKYCRAVLPHLSKKFFSDEKKVVFEIFLQYLVKYNRMPSVDALRIDLESSDKIDDRFRNEANLLLDSIRKTKDEPIDEQWFLETSEKWVKQRAVEIALFDSIAIIDGKDKQKELGAIPDILTKALSVSFDKTVGHDYFADVEDRFNSYHQLEHKLRFDVEVMNEITAGGVARKTLNVILAGTGGGKSMAMCHFASAYLSEGKNVLYITLEMSDLKIAERIDANLLDIAIDDLPVTTLNKFQSSIAKMRQKTQGALIIKDFPTASIHSGHIRALLDELKMKKNFIPDVIFVDYMNIMLSSRIRQIGGSINSYTYVKAIAEELRGLAVEWNVPIWTATQTNREGYQNTDVELTNTSESWGVPSITDIMFALVKTEEFDKENKILVKQLKNRYSDMNKKRRFFIGFEGDKMRLYDLEDPTKGIVQPMSVTVNSPVNTPFMSNASRKGRFDDLKV